jgi:hypothetical protein
MNKYIPISSVQRVKLKNSNNDAYKIVHVEFSDHSLWYEPLAYSNLYALYFRDNQFVEVLQLVPSRAVGTLGTGWGLGLRAHRLKGILSVWG